MSCRALLPFSRRAAIRCRRDAEFIAAAAVYAAADAPSAAERDALSAAAELLTFMLSSATLYADEHAADVYADAESDAERRIYAPMREAMSLRDDA